ncbi:MAG TPA: aminotransferase class III-fold pyridoxal phosphate-dependent enzyme, partial [Beutenbergiaceae bacterium]|nr:aminotransferase class III-fold pyridoxal phosphate-dependent enzyme [Beutenbergiaceae bacterium]
VSWGDLAAVRELLQDEDGDYAAVFCEPVLCNSGVLEPAEGFLEGLREVCQATGTVLVFDEVITGFRMAHGGAAQRYGVQPDLVVLAKAVAGGYPLAAVAGSAQILELTTEGVVHAGTYNGNPVVLAAAAATLAALDDPEVYRTFEHHGQTLAQGLRAELDTVGIAATVHQVGPVVQCMIGAAQSSSFDDFLQVDQDFYDRLIVEMLRLGVFALPGGRWYISTAHTGEDIAETVAVFGEALARTLRTGPGPRTTSAT